MLGLSKTDRDGHAAWASFSIYFPKAKRPLLKLLLGNLNLNLHQLAATPVICRQDSKVEAIREHVSFKVGLSSSGPCLPGRTTWNVCPGSCQSSIYLYGFIGLFQGRFVIYTLRKKKRKGKFIEHVSFFQAGCHVIYESYHIYPHPYRKPRH